MSLDVAIEAGAKKVFAWVDDWPGWCRSGRTEGEALDRVVAYRGRYARVASRAGLTVPSVSAADLAVVDRLAGGSGTDFGVPSSITDADARATDADEAGRLTALVAAAWETLDAVVATAPEALRKGPRGGGRDRDKMFAHTIEADEAYAREMGIRRPRIDPMDRVAVDALRGAMLDIVRTPSDGSALAGRTWPVRYAARRVAWHALDHAWEIEDRSES